MLNFGGVLRWWWHHQGDENAKLLKTDDIGTQQPQPWGVQKMFGSNKFEYLVPSWELTYLLPMALLKMMIFRLSQGGICIRSLECTPRKMNGWNLQPSPMKRKEHDLNQTSMIMFHLTIQGYSVKKRKVLPGSPKHPVCFMDACLVN